VAALSVLDGDMSQYISDNTDDEISHENFLNAYLTSKGASTVNFDQFRTLPSSRASGAIPRHQESRSRCDLPASHPKSERGTTHGDSQKQCRARRPEQHQQPRSGDC
jgi:hypothetical protein